MVGFIFGGKTGRSYEDLQQQRATAEALAAQIMGKLPTTALGGVGALLGGIGAGVSRYSANKGMKEGQQGANSAFDSILGKIMGGGSAPPSAPSASSANAGTMPMPGAAYEVAATSPRADVSKNGSTFDPFINTVQAGGLTNPYGLAAVAATGRSESGWDPRKAAGSWADPSESGQAGTSGGVMSWRAERLGNLRAYAASKGEQGNGTPETQAEFFMKEDPSLIAKLNAAKTPEESSGLMANAWKFAGYDRQGGEAGRRMSLASSYLPRFQGENTQVASLDPSSGMSAADAIEKAAPRATYRDPMVSAPNAQHQPAAASAPPMAAPAPQAVPQQQVAQNGQSSRAPQPSGAPQVPMNPYQGVDPEMMKLLSNPFLDPDKKAIIQTVIQQQMQAGEAARQEQQWRARQDYQTQQQRADPAYQLEMETKRAQLEALQAKPQKQWQKLDDGTLFNPETAEIKKVVGNPDGSTQFRFGGNSVEAQALNGLMESGALTPAQAQQLGAGKTISGPNGEIIFMTPQGVFGKSPDGSVAPMQGGTSLVQQTPQSVDIFAGTPETNAAAPQPVQQQAAPQTEQRPGMIPLTQGQGLDDKGRERRQMAIETGLDPNSDEGKRFILTGTLPASDRGVTAGDREAIRDADDQAQAARSAIEQLQSVIAPRDGNGPSLNDRAGSGALADWQAWAARNDPTGFFDDAKGEATTELSNTVLGQALGSLKSIFGAAPTEGERQILLDMQASVDKTPAERKIIIDKAIALANRKLKYQQDRASDLRGGDYYKSNRGQPNVQTNTPQTPAEAMGLPSIDGPTPNQRLRFNPATGDFE